MVCSAAGSKAGRARFHAKAHLAARVMYFWVLKVAWPVWSMAWTVLA
jgi:uncharacterized MAPEG superfamily protein